MSLKPWMTDTAYLRRHVANFPASLTDGATHRNITERIAKDIAETEEFLADLKKSRPGAVDDIIKEVEQELPEARAFLASLEAPPADPA